MFQQKPKKNLIIYKLFINASGKKLSVRFILLPNTQHIDSNNPINLNSVRNDMKQVRFCVNEVIDSISNRLISKINTANKSYWIKNEKKQIHSYSNWYSIAYSNMCALKFALFSWITTLPTKYWIVCKICIVSTYSQRNTQSNLGYIPKISIFECNPEGNT